MTDSIWVKDRLSWNQSLYYLNSIFFSLNLLKSCQKFWPFLFCDGYRIFIENQGLNQVLTLVFYLFSTNPLLSEWEINNILFQTIFSQYVSCEQPKPQRPYNPVIVGLPLTRVEPCTALLLTFVSVYNFSKSGTHFLLFLLVKYNLLQYEIWTFSYFWYQHLNCLRTEVRGDFNIHGTKKF